MKRCLAVFVVLFMVIAMIPSIAGAAAFNSTNDLNRDKLVPGREGQDAPHVNFIAHGENWVELEFVNNTNSQAFFEYRLDGEGRTEGTVHPVVPGDVIQAGVNVDGRGIDEPLIVTRKFEVNEKVEVRLCLGGERDWDFGWTEFYTFQFPSTNDLNKNKQVPGREGQDAPHINLIAKGEGFVELEFVNNTNSQAFFEFRIDGQIRSEGTAHPVVPSDYIYSGVNVDGRGVAEPLIVTRRFDVNEKVEVRLALGGERDWDFGWVTFESFQFPSTNDENRAKNRPHVNLVAIGNGWVDLEFVNDTNSLAFFEYRLDGVVRTEGNDHPVLAGDVIHPGVNVDGRGISEPVIVVRRFEVSEKVEIRLALGGERDWDFGWITFESLQEVVLDEEEESKIGIDPSGIGQEEAVKIVRPSELELALPVEILPGNVEVTVKKVSKEAPEGFKLLGSAYSFTMTDENGDAVTEFTGTMTITFYYDPAEVDNPDNLAIYWYNPVTEEWEAQESVVDKDNNKVTAEVDHWSEFAVMEAPEVTEDPGDPTAPELPKTGTNGMWLLPFGLLLMLVGGFGIRRQFVA